MPLPPQCGSAASMSVRGRHVAATRAPCARGSGGAARSRPPVAHARRARTSSRCSRLRTRRLSRRAPPRSGWPQCRGTSGRASRPRSRPSASASGRRAIARLPRPGGSWARQARSGPGPAPKPRRDSRGGAHRRKDFPPACPNPDPRRPCPRALRAPSHSTPTRRPRARAAPPRPARPSRHPEA